MAELKSSSRTRLILLVITLLLVGLVVLRRISVGEFNYNVDETVHACTGMYIADFIRNLPLAHPIRFTFLYYTHYPSLGLIHWPPFFYIAEGLAFLVGGFSVVVARITVLIFALIGCYFWFKTVEIFENPYTAAISTVVFALLPFVLLYEKTVMLEVPSLALCIAASYFWIKYVKWGGSKDLVFFTVAAVLALLTKQTSVYLALFCLFVLFSEKKWSLLRNFSVWKSVALCLLLTAPVYFVNVRMSWKVVQYDTLTTQNQGSPLDFYIRAIPEQLGPVILILSVSGILTCVWWGRWATARVMLLWILSCYLTMTAFAIKNPRYIIYWIPPFVYFAIGPFLSSRLPRFSQLVGGAVIVLLLCYSIARAWVFERPTISGYAKAAQVVSTKANSGFLLFDAELPGNFIFFLHGYDAERRFVVLRKALYATRQFKERGSVEFVKTQSDLEKLIDLFGIRLVIVDNAKPEFASQELLREYLHSSRFRLIDTIPVETNMPGLRGRELFVYENIQPSACRAELVHTEMMSLPFNLDIPPVELGLNCGISEVHVP